jgi:spermidine/putrescine transport system permease protein
MANARKAKPARAPLDYLSAFWMRGWLGLVFLFLYLPLFVLMLFSFNDSKANIVWKGFTLKWYQKAFENDQLREALFNSLLIAAACTVLSLVLGALMAFMFWRFRFPWKGQLESGMSLPIVVPEICFGIAVLMFYAEIDKFLGKHGLAFDLPWPLSLTQIIIAHTTFAFPFVAIVVRARLESFNQELESAALDLGASPFQAFRDVIVPHMQPGLVAGALLAFTLSLDDFVITFFASGPGTITFPVKVYSMVRFSVTPEVNAASTIVILMTVLATWFALRTQTQMEKESQKS